MAEFIHVPVPFLDDELIILAHWDYSPDSFTLHQLTALEAINLIRKDRIRNYGVSKYRFCSYHKTPYDTKNFWVFPDEIPYSMTAVY